MAIEGINHIMKGLFVNHPLKLNQFINVIKECGGVDTLMALQVIISLLHLLQYMNIYYYVHILLYCRITLMIISRR